MVLALLIRSSMSILPTLVGSAALAQPKGSFYDVLLANTVEVSKPVIRGLVFSCQSKSCSANEGNSRPAIMCVSVARELGAVMAFRAGEETLEDDALAKCNAKAGHASSRD